MKRLLTELRRWSKQRAVVCRDCDLADLRRYGRRFRTPIAKFQAEQHRLITGHKCKAVRFG